MEIESLIIKYGQIALNRSINEKIYQCFQYIIKDDVVCFVAKFKEQKVSDDSQVMHTYRELILGAYLCSRGFNARYEQKVNGKTPDWILLRRNCVAIECIIELINFHIDRAIDSHMAKSWRIWTIFSLSTPPFA